MKLKLGNAACMVRTGADVKPLLGIDNDILHSITLGSFTVQDRTGNAGETYWDDDAAHPTSLNSRGMPNRGYDWLKLGESHELITLIRASGKLARLSIAGFDIDDYVELATLMRMNGVDELELNLGCPNTGHRVMSFEPQSIEELIRRIWKACSHLGAPSLSYKFSPYSDPYLLKEVAAVLAAAPAGAVQKIVTCNTFPNCIGFQRDGSPAIAAMGKEYGGLGGHALKRIALGQVRQFREELPERIKIIGVGGVSSWIDVHDLYLAGADEVQIGTAFVKYGSQIFHDIAEEYAVAHESEPA